jgi:hypothetical protein
LTTSSSAPWSIDPDNKFNVQEIEDVGLVPMASVTDLLDAAPNRARSSTEKCSDQEV